MTIEAQIASTLEPLFSGGAWPDVAPGGIAPPYCIYQQVGGSPVQALCGPGRKNMRLQVWVWSRTRAEANALLRAAADELSAELGAVHIDELIAQHDDAVNLYGAHQDFSIWYHE